MLTNSSRVIPTSPVEDDTPENVPYSPLVYYLPKKRLDRWYVCKDFLNGVCKNSESECELAHPTPGKEVKNDIVTVCMDHVNDQCKRSNCKYLHPPQHISDQIHDHKKKPHLGLRPRSLSNSSERELSEFANSSEEPFQARFHFPHPFNLYYPNPHPNAVYFPPFSRPPLGIPGQGIGASFPFQNPEFQFPPGVQEIVEGLNFDRNSQDQLPFPGYPILIPQFCPPIITN